MEVARAFAAVPAGFMADERELNEQAEALACSERSPDFADVPWSPYDSILSGRQPHDG